MSEVRRLFRVHDNIVGCYDPDTASLATGRTAEKYHHLVIQTFVARVMDHLADLLCDEEMFYEDAFNTVDNLKMLDIKRLEKMRPGSQWIIAFPQGKFWIECYEG